MHLLYAELFRLKAKSDGLTQDELARRSGLLQPTVSRVLAWIAEPSPETRDKLDPVLALGTKDDLVYLAGLLEDKGLRFLSDDRDPPRPIVFADRDLADLAAAVLSSGQESTPQVYSVPARMDFAATLCLEALEASGADEPPDEDERLVVDPPGDDRRSVLGRVGRIIDAYARRESKVTA